MNKMSPERLMLVAAALEGLLATKACGPVVGPEAEGAAEYYANAAVKFADVTLEVMNPMIPIVPPVEPTTVIVEEEVIINK